MSDFGEGKMIRSRKAHRCEWCGQQIKGGTCYNYRGMYDGEWQNWYMHPECERDYAKSDELEFFPYDNERPSAHEVGDEGGAR